ncbi:uncharacterized protein AAES06_005160 isoform 1-T1 [Glossophaga mutica]
MERKRREEAGNATQTLSSSPILGSGGPSAALHPLSVARAAPSALIGSQRRAAGADRLMRARALRPLGDKRSGRRWGGGQCAREERKGDLLHLLFNLENENQYPFLLSLAVMVEKMYRILGV